MATCQSAFIQKLCAHGCCMKQWRDHRYILQSSSRLANAEYNNGETAIFGIYYNEPLCYPSMYTTMAIAPFLAYTLNTLPIDVYSNDDTVIFGLYGKEALYSLFDQW